MKKAKSSKKPYLIALVVILSLFGLAYLLEELLGD